MSPGRGRGSEAELLLERQLTALGVSYDREVRFHPMRRWRFDFVVGERLAVEINGGQWAPGGGRHGGDKDREKLAEAAIRGWRIIPVSPGQVRSGEAVSWILRAIGDIRGAKLPWSHAKRTGNARRPLQKGEKLAPRIAAQLTDMHARIGRNASANR